MPGNKSMGRSRKRGAHYFHMTDTLETAAACGLCLTPNRPDEPAMEKQPDKPARDQKFDEIIVNWFPLTFALNSLNRGMGLADAYPFVLTCWLRSTQLRFSP